MIPKISTDLSLQPLYLSYLDDLESAGFEGDIRRDFASRTVLSTDNSIYQIQPQAVLYPKGVDDLQRIAELAAQKKYHTIVLSPRGGGTGTNGQSLTDGIVVDLSKHMNQILEINQFEGWVRVQTGVVKDQLNAALKPMGLFFAPELSTSNRATIGGMINTDASGQGSCLYGKTRDHVIELKTVLLDGSIIKTEALNDEAFEAHCVEQNRSGLVHRLINNIASEHKILIEEKFPKLNRCLTGYDLAHIRDKNGQFNLNNILCGSEGTLGFIAEAKLRVLPIPKYSALVVVKYADFNGALRDAKRLMHAKPTSIETIDSKVLNLAMEDIVWHEVEEFFPETGEKVQGINLVEYTGDSAEALKKSIARLKKILIDHSTPHCIGHSLAWGNQAVAKLWNMRKRAVGLLGNAKGEARPIPFVEDTAVPPEHLADFILEFRALLDEHKLQYGMFGHVDAGVLHVRPAIDMKDQKQLALVRDISDKVAELTQKYHGLLWGEHGKGVRSEYAPKFFGELYPQLQRIKAAFDPHNQLNPGKIATPSQDLQLLKIDEVTTRGENDALIPAKNWKAYSEAVYCNGNGACYNWNFNDAMCPSWKVTRDRIHSPKGRAALIKEWLKLGAANNFDADAQMKKSLKTSGIVKFFTYPARLVNSAKSKSNGDDFSHQVYDAMQGCLACKSCVGQCPIKVDVPSFRSKFLALYYTRYARPLKDYLVGSLEFLLPIVVKVSGLYNFVMRLEPTRWLLSKIVGFEDAPLLSKKSLLTLARNNKLAIANAQQLKALSDGAKKRTVLIVQDAFTSYFEAEVVMDIADLLKKLGFNVMLLPYKPNGKPLHVHGFLARFNSVATKQANLLKKAQSFGVSLIGIDPAMTLTYRSEYPKTIGSKNSPKVYLLQEFLAKHLDYIRQLQPQFEAGEFKLLPHCTEKTNAASSPKQWQAVFHALGQKLDIVSVGCCGMSGTYGHETKNRENSAELFSMSWQAPVTSVDNQNKICATGYSCRSQSKREAYVKVPHPAQLLLGQLKVK